MKKSNAVRNTLLVVSVLVIASLLAVPYAIGLSAEKEFRAAEANMAQAGNYPVQVKPAYFHRGWFSSEARTQYIIGSGQQSALLSVNHHISQIPVPFVRWARVRHEITHFDIGGLNISTPGELDFHTDRLFSGGTAMHIGAPLITITPGDNSDISLKDMQFDLRSNDDQSRQLNFRLPTVSMVAPNRVTSITITNVSMTSNDSNMRDAQAVWQQAADAKMELLDVSTGGTSMFNIKNLSLHADLKDRGANVDVIYHTNMESSTTGGVGGFNVKNLNLDFSYLNLNKAALLGLQKAIRELNANAADSDDTRNDPVAAQAKMTEMMQTLLKQSGPLIASSPVFRIDRLDVSTSYGNISGKGELHVNGDNFNPDELNKDNLVASFKARVSGNGNLKAARDIFVHVDGVDRNARMQKQMKENMLMTYEQKGYVEDDGTTLTIDANMGPEGFLLNGKPLVQNTD